MFLFYFSLNYIILFPFCSYIIFTNFYIIRASFLSLTGLTLITTDSTAGKVSGLTLTFGTIFFAAYALYKYCIRLSGLSVFTSFFFLLSFSFPPFFFYHKLFNIKCRTHGRRMIIWETNMDQLFSLLRFALLFYCQVYISLRRAEILFFVFLVANPSNIKTQYNYTTLGFFPLTICIKVIKFATKLQ